MAQVRLTGVFPILPTPFDEREDLDLDSFARLVRFTGEVGCDGVTILGVLGEANRLLDVEREQLIRAAVEAAAGRLPVVVGTSHSGTAATRRLSQEAAALGAAAVMVTPSREPVPSEERVGQYFQQVAAGLELPMVVQDHPASTQVHMSVPLLLRLVRELSQVACIKAESPPTPSRISALRAGMSGRQVPVLGGLGALYGLFELERGADGFMTGFAFPEVLLAMVRAAQHEEWERVRRLYTRFLPLIVFEQQPGVAIRKEVYRRRGLLRTSQVRHPGAPLDPATAAQLDNLLAAVLPGVDLTRPLSLESP